jgi:WASH complex subunit 7
MHILLGIPILKSAVVHLCKLIELMKNIQFMYFSKSIAIAESSNHIMQHLTFQSLVAIGNAKVRTPTLHKKTSY